MKTKITKLNKYKKIAIWFLLLANLSLAGGYTFAVNRTVFNVVATSKAQRALSTNTATMADLESKYIALSNNLTLDFAYAQGYKDASDDQIFIPSKSVSGGLSFNVR